MPSGKKLALDPGEALRHQLLELLGGGHAHATFKAATADFPADRAGLRPTGAPRSAWELLEHMRIAQNDILLFSHSADHVSPSWPDGYWPSSPSGDWTKSVRVFERDLARFQELIRDPAADLLRPFPWGDGQSLLREALVLADHNSYHLGQLVQLRRLLGAWSG